MDKFTAFLKKKGPLGMPMAFWAGLAAVVLFLGYRWYKAKSGGSSSSSTDTTSSDTTGVDTTGGATPSPDVGTDSPQPSDGLVPGSTETPPPVSTGTGSTSSTEPKTGHKKKPKPKHKPATHHDHRQGTHHTNHKRLPKQKSPHHHAPVTPKRKHSPEKRKETANVRAHHEATSGARHHPGVGAVPVAPKRPPVKIPPTAIRQPQPEKKATEPIRKRRRG